MPLVQKATAVAANRMPKMINPTAHAAIDYAVAGAFFIMGAVMWGRGKKRAALGSFVCGGAAAVNSILTDYPGGLVKKMSYRTHGRVDVGLAGLTAAMPNFFGFDEDHEARFFTGMALGGTVATGMTDFSALDTGAQTLQRRRPIAA